LNLGLVNVNPLFSLQVTKNELGEKLVKPLVNLHVTPNENIIGKIGNLLLAKKGSLHNHYHHHSHRYPPPPPIYHDDHHVLPHHIEGPPPFISHHGPGSQFPPFISKPPIFDGPPPHLIFSRPPPPFFKSANGISKDIYFDDINPSSFRSNNISLDDFSYQSVYPEKSFNGLHKNEDNGYARTFSNYNAYSLPTQAPGNNEGSERVSFPTSRRRRDTDQPVPASIEEKLENNESAVENEDAEGRAISANKRQAYYQQQQKQCGPRAVCCRKPFAKPPPVQYNRCGVRSAQGINGRIKNPVYVDGNSEFGEWPW
jgi:hypothetical protein